jgi:hypothetical protein
MTPQEIAREAAEEFLADSFPTMSQFLAVEACHKARRDRVAALILSAAAKMVRESGAHHLEAITTDQGRLCEAVHHGKGDYHTGLAPCPVCLRIESALTALRALTEHSGKPQAGR